MKRVSAFGLFHVEPHGGGSGVFGGGLARRRSPCSVSLTPLFWWVRRMAGLAARMASAWSWSRERALRRAARGGLLAAGPVTVTHRRPANVRSWAVALPRIRRRRRRRERAGGRARGCRPRARRSCLARPRDSPGFLDRVWRWGVRADSTVPPSCPMAVRRRWTAPGSWRRSHVGSAPEHGPADLRRDRCLGLLAGRRARNPASTDCGARLACRGRAGRPQPTRLRRQGAQQGDDPSRGTVARSLGVDGWVHSHYAPVFETEHRSGQ